MSVNQSISPKESIAIGKIANFFGSRYGVYNIDRTFEVLGIVDLPKGNKSEKISFVLRDFYTKDKASFVACLEELIENHQLNPSDIEKLRAYAINIGFDIENKRVVQSPSKEIVTSEGKPYDAFKIIETILLSARKRIYIIDPYVDHSLFTLYLECVDKNVEIKILTRNMHNKFKAIAQKFKAQRGNFEVRLLDNIHDRQILVDNRAWLFGQSLKNAGEKPLNVIEYNNSSLVERAFTELWSKAKSFL
jgi:hypothetical protein